MNGILRFTGLLIFVIASTLMAGAQLTLAQTDITCTQDVTVQADDWLSKLAEKYLEDALAYPTIIEATNMQAQADASYATIDNPDLIEVGWKLCIPDLGDHQAMAQDSQITTAEIAYYVSPAGSDDNDGSEALPWQTIQYAIDQAEPGATIYVMDGVYNEAVTFNTPGSAEGGYLTLRNYPEHHPVLDGEGLADSADGLIRIEDQAYIKVIGFEVRNLVVSGGDFFPAGIWVTGASHHIELRNNLVHHIENRDCDECGAHGIAVYGTNGDESIHDIIIDGNEVRDCILGWSESMVLNGNVENFIVSNNIVHDNNNIGIDLIGFEGTSPNPETDRARDGVVSGNLVYNIDSGDNPAYYGERSADGIYVDGGTRIVIEQNIVHHSNIGIELASEHAGKDTSYISVRNNLVQFSHQIGLAFGGYDTERGSTHHCEIINNTFYHNDTDQAGAGEIYIQFDTSHNTIKNNIIVANEQNLFISNDYLENNGNVVDYNLYFSPGGADGSIWGWRQETYKRFSEWQHDTGQDAHSLFADPKFVDAANGDFHLQADSPARNAGDTLDSHTIGTSALDGADRVQDDVVDLGAYEG